MRQEERRAASGDFQQQGMLDHTLCAKLLCWDISNFTEHIWFFIQSQQKRRSVYEWSYSQGKERRGGDVSSRNLKTRYALKNFSLFG